jgi:hypothetical protein
MLVKIVDRIIDRLMEIRITNPFWTLDCGVRSNDWIDHIHCETPECKKAMERYWSEKRTLWQ